MGFRGSRSSRRLCPLANEVLLAAAAAVAPAAGAAAGAAVAAVPRVCAVFTGAPRRAPQNVEAPQQRPAGPPGDPKERGPPEVRHPCCLKGSAQGLTNKLLYGGAPKGPCSS